MNLLTAPLTEAGAGLAGAVIPLTPAVRSAAARDSLTELVIGIRPEHLHRGADRDAAGADGTAAPWPLVSTAGARACCPERCCWWRSSVPTPCCTSGFRSRRRCGGTWWPGPRAQVAGAGAAGRLPRPARGRLRVPPADRRPARGLSPGPAGRGARPRPMEDSCGPSCSTAPAASGWRRCQTRCRGQDRSWSRWMPAGSAARTSTSWTASSRRPRIRSRRATSSPAPSPPSRATSRSTCRSVPRSPSTPRCTAATAGAAGPAGTTCARTGRPSATPWTARSPSTWRSRRSTRTGFPTASTASSARWWSRSPARCTACAGSARCSATRWCWPGPGRWACCCCSCSCTRGPGR